MECSIGSVQIVAAGINIAWDMPNQSNTQHIVFIKLYRFALSVDDKIMLIYCAEKHSVA
jgi:hypothetical protein